MALLACGSFIPRILAFDSARGSAGLAYPTFPHGRRANDDDRAEWPKRRQRSTEVPPSHDDEPIPFEAKWGRSTGEAAVVDTLRGAKHARRAWTPDELDAKRSRTDSSGAREGMGGWDEGGGNICSLKWEMNESEIEGLLKAASTMAPPKTKKREPYTVDYISALRRGLDLTDNLLDIADFACLTITSYLAARLGEFAVETLTGPKSFKPTEYNTPADFIQVVHAAPDKVGLDHLQGHGIRIGSAPEYLLRGVPFDVMKSEEGRWASDAFQLYLRKHQILAPYMQARSHQHEPRGVRENHDAASYKAAIAFNQGCQDGAKRLSSLSTSDVVHTAQTSDLGNDGQLEL
ncbi:hypothetical protein DFP72DRAFT_1076671 [Ephemerocybe angulata]|uniref:Uncharacterized protein n=1 Tax=Ephemerocybe angulata TaxID=980116 RepID=A0A8H6HI03_9AGAR|nr:hypothetical protein DFP72DRAFT_1076671 [Tulosesus angulatus]